MFLIESNFVVVEVRNLLYKFLYLMHVFDLSTMEAKSDFLFSAIAPKPPSWMPMLEKLAKPQSAYVAMMYDLNRRV